MSQFDEQFILLNNLRVSTEQLIRVLLNKRNINPHQIISRVKDRKSLEHKIINKNYKYDSIEEITDIVGIRIITYLEDEIDLVASIIKDEFDIDIENSVDKRLLDADRFGYRSLHFVAFYNNSRLKLSEYSNFKKIKFEIQIRSILQHSWAEIEHDIGYKGEFEIPDSAKRTFFRVAALLEQADIEFVKLKNEIAEYESTVGEKIKSVPSTVEINKASVISYLTNSKIVTEVEDRIINARKDLELDPIEELDYILDDILIKLNDKGLNTISDIEKLYIDNKDKFIEEQIERFKNNYDLIGFIQGATLLWLLKS